MVSGVVALLLLLEFLGAAAACPALHAAVCPDAGKATDSCVVVVFATGKVASSSHPVLCVSEVARYPVALLPPSEVHPATSLFRLSPSRAPPL